jgi:hypothetical protein
LYVKKTRSVLRGVTDLVEGTSCGNLPEEFCDIQVAAESILVKPGLHEEPFPLHVTSPIAVIPNTEHRRSAVLSAKLADFSVALLELFRPSVLSVLALILVVGGWTYGYRLSHYQHNPDVTKASTIRMWVDQRHDSVVLPAPQQIRPHALISLALCCLGVLRLPHLSKEEVFAAPVQSAVATFVSPLHPLRAPPASLSSLA